MKLHELQYTEGSRKNSFRVGRGQGSGNGKTSGKGHKGQKARSGGMGGKLGFEGGQTPLARRLPKRGFTNFTRTEYAIINLCQLNEFENGTVIDPTVLKQIGLVKDLKDGIKVLGEGELDKKLTVKAHKFSKTAKEMIEKAGGTVEEL